MSAWFLVAWIGMGLVGALLAYGLKGRMQAGFVLGFLLGPIGWLSIKFLEDRRRWCPKCGKPIDSSYQTCGRCGAAVPPAVQKK